MLNCSHCLLLVWTFTLHLFPIRCHGFWFDFIILFRCVSLVSLFAGVFKLLSFCSLLSNPIRQLCECVAVLSFCGLLLLGFIKDYLLPSSSCTCVFYSSRPWQKTGSNFSFLISVCFFFFFQWITLPPSTCSAWSRGTTPSKDIWRNSWVSHFGLPSQTTAWARSYTLDWTPLHGCPGRALEGASQTM